MKAFIVKRKYSVRTGEKDYLVISSTKKEALKAFEEQVDEFNPYTYLKKDVEEVNILSIEYSSMTIIPKNMENYGLSSCFNFDIFVKTDYEKYYENKIISEDEKTVKELIRLFKEEYKKFFSEYL